ncbi:LegC family aminotransferase [Virgibacillus halodenitrificans]|uniref:LegC family aminotransferase n=1 Tax=Virgibacillus halodenitrificans TaxID=1482 RepID=UPI001F410151|nr:LegC family aminotransferase [Virgibacillus halodenitrificans]
MIPLSVPNLKGNELKYVTEAVEAEWVSTGGSFINKFENNLAEYLNVNQAVACQSGTAGLHLALRLAGVKAGEEILVPTLTFIAAVNPVKYMGAAPVFLDCDESLCIDVDKLEKFCETECTLTEAGLVHNKTGKNIRALVVVHIFGNLADMERLMQVAEKYNLKVIEDATEALGTYYTEGKYDGKHAGTIGDFGVYSFNGNKIITTGGGGMLIAKQDELANKARYLSTQAKNDDLYYIHDEVGYNYRMTNLQAALGVAQLEQLEGFINTKTANYNLYKDKISGIQGLSIMEFRDGTRPNHWFYSLLIDDEKFGMDRDTLLVKLNAMGVQTRPIWGLIHQQKPYLKNDAYQIETANRSINSILNLPCSSNLTSEEVLQVIETIKNLKS